MMMGDCFAMRVKSSKFEVPEEADDSPRRLGGRRRKIAVVAVVLLAGVAAAVVFRKKPSDDSPQPSSTDAPLVLRDAPSNKPKPSPAPHLVGRIEPVDAHDAPAPASQEQKATAITDRRPPPLLSPTYPEPSQAADRERADFAPAPPVASPAPRERVHRVRDGDTLSELARRYFHDGALYMRIFEANSKAAGGVLESPDLLPIGAELKIPAADRAAPPEVAGDAEDPQPLVPIPPGALKRGS